MKLNPKELKNVDYKKLALKHGEKAAMAVCGVVLILGIYSFFKAASSDYSPQQLDALVDKADDFVEKNAAPEVSSEGPFATLARQHANHPIQLAAVAWPDPFWRPLKGRGQRGEPQYLAAVEPEVSAEQVTVEVKAPAAVGAIAQRRVQKENKEGEEEPVAAPTRTVRPYNYATVRFLVPLAEQIEEFRNANLPTMPVYFEFHLERQTLLSGGNWGSWEAINLEHYMAESDDWASISPPVVPPSAISESLTCQLPSRVVGDWKEHGGHTKLAALAATQNAAAQPEDAEQQKKPDSNQKLGGFARRPAAAAQPRQGGVGSAIAPQFRRFPQQDPTFPAGQGQGQGQAGGQYGGSNQGPGAPIGQQRFQGAGQVPPAAQQQQQQQQQLQPQGASAASQVQSEWLLFRFLDLSVEPGKSYRYRVQLVLRNPNYQVAQELLQDGNKALAEGEFRESPWSEPTPIVTVPSNLRYFVVGGDRDALTLDLFWIDPELGSMAAEAAAKDANDTRPLKAPFHRGDFVAISNETGWDVDLNRNVKVRKTDITANTSDALIDFSGGREVLDLGDDFSREVRDVTRPYVALLLDSQGRWIKRHEKSDQNKWLALCQRLISEHQSAKDEKEEKDKDQGFQGQGQGGFQGGFQGQGQGGFQGQQGQGGFQGGFQGQGQGSRGKRGRN